MNKFLKAASLRYELEESKIQPISKVDAEIISEIVEVLRKIGIVDIKTILDKYKYLKDEDILNALLQWNIDHPDRPSKDEEAEYSDEKETNHKLLKIGGEYMISSTIYGFRVDYDELKLVINPTYADKVTSRNPYVNYCIFFRDESEMENVVEELKKIINLDTLNLY